MSIRTEFVNVIDLESTCWRRPKDKPDDQRQEIIEIGICAVNIPDLEIVGKEAIFVKPIHSEVSDFCTELTSITPEMVEDGYTLNEAFDILKNEYDSHNRIWASWGDWDRKMFQKDCLTKGVQYPFADTHFNIKALYSLHNGLTTQRGLGKACRLEGLEFDGTHHRGVDDAYMISQLLLRLLQAE